MITPLLIMLLVLVAVVVYRGVDARLRLDDAAHQAARAASLERSPGAAVLAAQSTADAALGSARVSCASLTATTSTAQFRPGGTVTVTLACQVNFGDALLLGVPTTQRLSSTATEPVDTFRAINLPAPGSTP